MNDYEFAKLIRKAMELHEEKTKNNKYILKPETAVKISRILQLTSKYCVKAKFDISDNAFDIELQSYVFDNLTEHMKEVFELADIFTIDALDDGMVSIELRILEAGILISEN
jgi:hypothetical protein